MDDIIEKPIDSEYFTLNEKGLKSEDSGFTIVILLLAFSMLFTLSIFASSGFLLQSVIEEKENRIMEVILSSVSHEDLLKGKIIGLGALGLTQVLIYLVLVMFWQFIFSSPNESLAIALSIFPLTSPIAMIMRLSITDVPIYELMISILVLVVSAYFILEISTRIFKASLLMYGKKPTIKELIKYVRQN